MILPCGGVRFDSGADGLHSYLSDGYLRVVCLDRVKHRVGLVDGLPVHDFRHRHCHGELGPLALRVFLVAHLPMPLLYSVIVLVQCSLPRPLNQGELDCALISVKLIHHATLFFQSAFA